MQFRDLATMAFGGRDEGARVVLSDIKEKRDAAPLGSNVQVDLGEGNIKTGKVTGHIVLDNAYSGTAIRVELEGDDPVIVHSERLQGDVWTVLNAPNWVNGATEADDMIKKIERLGLK
jgi:hypothetical protein